ncbi:MAG TPA: hypothetical protein VMV91_04020 [Rhodocyclaceae bacterium]|nr:hypothetical protein [Rhodocyclaceae bacterium]
MNPTTKTPSSQRITKRFKLQKLVPLGGLGTLVVNGFMLASG